MEKKKSTKTHHTNTIVESNSKRINKFEREKTSDTIFICKFEANELK